jgi:hypothetical protein
MSGFEAEELDNLRRFSLTRRQHALRALRFVAYERGVPPVIITFALAIAACVAIYLVAAAFAFWKARVGPSSVGADIDQVLGRRSIPAHGVPLVRDYGFLLLTLWTALTFTRCTRQWTRLERLPAILARGGLLRTDLLTSEFLREEFVRLENRSRKARWDVLAAALAVVLTALTAKAILESGVYPLSDVATDGSVGVTHYRHWWANPTTDAPGFALVIAIVLTYGYITIRHSILGAHVLLWLRSMHGRARGQHPPGEENGSTWFGYSDRWADPEEALGELRGALLDVFASVLLGALALGTAVYLFDFPSQLVAVLVTYLGVNILAFVLPWIYMNRELARSKRQLRATVLSELRRIDVSDRAGRSWDLQCLAYARVAEFPDRVLDRLPVGGLIALYLIPVLGMLPAYR